jgi:colicin import membrane protein
MMSIMQIRSILFTIILIAVQACIVPARAQTDEINRKILTELSVSEEFAKLKQERAVIDANLKKQEAVCYKKFAVNNCLKDAKTEAQAALNAVKRRENEINDQQRNAKIESDQSKKEKISSKKVGNNTDDKTSEVKDKTRTVKPVKPAKAIQSDADILAKKNAAEKSRADAAQKRLAETNLKQAASQKKAQTRANKNSQSAVNAAKYNQKLIQAEEHKQALEKARLEKKPKSAPLPMPTITAP